MTRRKIIKAAQPMRGPIDNVHQSDALIELNDHVLSWEPLKPPTKPTAVVRMVASGNDGGWLSLSITEHGGTTTKMTKVTLRDRPALYALREAANRALGE